jgi:hypothetical protein
MFGLAAVHRERVGNEQIGKFDAQSVPMIAVGRCSTSNGLLFYNPANGTFVSSIDYKFQLHTTIGAHFNYKYQPGTFLYRLDKTNSIFAPKFCLESTVLVHTHSPPSVASVIEIPTYASPNIYTVMVFKDGSISEYTEDLLSLAPEQTSQEIFSFLPGFRGVQTPPYFYLICQSLVMELCNFLQGSGIFSQESLKRAFFYRILLPLVNNYWIQANYSMDMRNSKLFMILAIKLV